MGLPQAVKVGDGAGFVVMVGVGTSGGQRVHSVQEQLSVAEPVQQPLKGQKTSSRPE